MKVWDTAGQEKFRVMGKSYYYKADGIILAMAVNNWNSFENTKLWLKTISECIDIKKIQLLIIGTKIDLEDGRQVSTIEISKLAEELGVEFLETSSKQNININEAFNKIFQAIITNNTVKKSGISLGENENMSMSGKKCC